MRIHLQRDRGGFQLGPFDLGGDPHRPWLVLGESGSGKTSLLQLLAGSGEPGTRGSPLPSAARPAYLPQLPERALAGRNLAEDLCGDVRPPLAKRLELRRSLEDVGLQGIPLSRRSRDLSAGERRRVAVALLRLSPSRVWALDEPEAGLDLSGRGLLAQRLASWWGDGSLRGLWIATHHFELYARLRPQVLVLAGGGLVAQGELEEVLAREDVFGALELGRRAPFRVWKTLGEGFAGISSANLMKPTEAGGRVRQLQVILANRAGLR
jgi:energy-coupling factor transporter ATP-binding protein EcfA2